MSLTNNNNEKQAIGQLINVESTADNQNNIQQTLTHPPPSDHIIQRPIENPSINLHPSRL